MAILDIVTFPEPSLRLKSKQVTKFDTELQTLIDNMFETMRAAPGVGLAAPQIGESLRLVVVEYTENEEDAEDAQLVILSVGEDDEGEYLDVVEDDETLLEVSKLFEQRLSDDYEID